VNMRMRAGRPSGPRFSVFLAVLALSVCMPGQGGMLSALPALDLSAARPFAFNVLVLSDPDGMSGEISLEGLRWNGDSVPLFSAFIPGRPDRYEMAAYLDDSLRAVVWTLDNGVESARGEEDLPSGFDLADPEALHLPRAPARINASLAAPEVLIARSGDIDVRGMSFVRQLGSGPSVFAAIMIALLSAAAGALAVVGPPESADSSAPTAGHTASLLPERGVGRRPARSIAIAVAVLAGCIVAVTASTPKPRFYSVNSVNSVNSAFAADSGGNSLNAAGTATMEFGREKSAKGGAERFDYVPQGVMDAHEAQTLRLVGLWTPGETTLPLSIIEGNDFPVHRYRLSPIPAIVGVRAAKGGRNGFAIAPGGFIAGWSTP